MAVMMTTEYDPHSGVTNTITADLSHVRNFDCDGHQVRISFKGGVTEARLSGYISRADLEENYISKEKLVELLEKRRDALNAELRRCCASESAHAAYSTQIRSQEVSRIICDIEIEEIDIP